MASPSKPIAGPSKQPSISSEPIVMQTFPLEPDSASYRRQRRKLPQEAYSILSNYFHTVSQDPDIHARRQLLAEIHKIPGADWYTSATLSQWFVSKRARMPVEQRRHIDGGISTDDILWPSFNASTIDMLRVLLDDTPSPTDAHFNVWSRTLRVERSHLLNWVQLYQADTSQTTTQRPREARNDATTRPLPTPEATASPEPYRQDIPSLPASPVLQTPVTYQETYVSYGAPAHIGTTQPSHAPAFLAVQPAGLPPTVHVPMIPTTSHRVATPERPRLPPTARPDSPTISTSNTSKRKEVRLRFSSPITSSDFSMYPSHTRSISSAAQSAHETGFGSSQRVDDLRTGLPSSRAKVANVEQPSIPTLRLAELASGSVLPPPSTFFSPPISSFDTQPEPSEQSLVGSRSAPSIQGSSPFLTKLCDAVHTRLIELNSKTPSPPPKTFAELAERMKPAVQFAEAVERGEYASFGIVPVKQSRNRGEAPSDFEG